jgi:hypothetical protein
MNRWPAVCERNCQPCIVFLLPIVNIHAAAVAHLLQCGRLERARRSCSSPPTPPAASSPSSERFAILDADMPMLKTLIGARCADERWKHNEGPAVVDLRHSGNQRAKRPALPTICHPRTGHRFPQPSRAAAISRRSGRQLALSQRRWSAISAAPGRWRDHGIGLILHAFIPVIQRNPASLLAARGLF